MFSQYYQTTRVGKMIGSAFVYVWWKLMPGYCITVKWPVGMVEFTDYESPDPNDHYRPWLEENVGKQGWDWDWEMTNNDITTNSLTIKFRLGKKSYAMMAALKWT